jgi:hypothetical protein
MKEKKVMDINNKHLQGLRMAIKDAYGWGGGEILFHFQVKTKYLNAFIL